MAQLLKIAHKKNVKIKYFIPNILKSDNYVIV